MTVKVLDGNRAAAYGVLLAQPDVIAVYPITPQTPLAEQLARFHAEGLLKADLVEVEGENSAMGVVTGACVAGGRVFTATSSWGLAFMYDALMFCAGMRVPVVMVDVTREAPLMRGVLSGRSDLMSIRDSGWVQIEAESCQEILDSILMAYRVAEDVEILLPVVVGYDGFYLSHLAEPVDIPAQEVVDAFLAPLKEMNRLKLAPGTNLDFATTVPQGQEVLFAEYRYKHSLALERAKTKIEEVEQEFFQIFGRAYGGLVETYRVEDAEVVLVTAGSCAGTAKVVVDRAREAGRKVGLARIRVFRPFPRERLRDILGGRKGVGVLDRSVCLGWHCGHLFMEIKAIWSEIKEPPRALVNFIDGIGNLDITAEHIQQALDLTCQAAQGEPVPEVNWLMFSD